MLSPKDLALVPKLRAQGIRMPVRCLMAVRSTGLPLAVAASMLIQESGGGVNEWGHDRDSAGRLIPPAVEGRLLVTKANVTRYLAHRGVHGEFGMQGCGVTQLTYYTLQDEATRRGGLWKPLVQMQVGFGDLAALIRRDGLRMGVAGYNGEGPAADAYAQTVIERADRIARALGLPPLA